MSTIEETKHDEKNASLILHDELHSSSPSMDTYEGQLKLTPLLVGASINIPTTTSLSSNLITQPGIALRVSNLHESISEVRTIIDESQLAQCISS